MAAHVPDPDGPPVELNLITGDIVGAAIKVQKAFGPGLLERVYQRCLARELQLRGRLVEAEMYLPVRYEGETIEAGYRVDLLVDRRVVVEVKHVEDVADIHRAQVYTYLKLLDLKIGLIVNFNTRFVRDGVHRIIRR